MTLRPLNDRIVVELDPPEDKTAGGLFLPDESLPFPWKGTVLAVGPGRLVNKRGLSIRRLPVSVREGDRVVIDRWQGVDIDAGGQDVKILRGEDVLGWTD